MDAVKGYVMCVLLASAIAGILKNLSSGMRGFEKYVGLVCSLAVVMILATPLAGIVSDIREVISDDISSPNKENLPEENETSAKEVMAGYLADSLKETVRSLVCEKFSLSNEDISVSTEFNEDYSVKKIILVVYSDISEIELKSFAENILCISTEIRKEDNKDRNEN